MTVEVWCVRMERPLTEQERSALLPLLPPERRARLARLRDPRRGDGPLCAWALLRLALKQACGWEELPRVAWGDRGKPYFPEHPEVCFNLSHTDGAVLAALGGSPVGVDIEKLRPVGKRLSEQLGTGSETAFFQSWVRREALGKRSGRGLSGAFRAEVLPAAGEDAREWMPFPGYMAGIAVGSGEILEKHAPCLLDEMLRLTFAG